MRRCRLACHRCRTRAETATAVGMRPGTTGTGVPGTRAAGVRDSGPSPRNPFLWYCLRSALSAYYGSVKSVA